MKHRVGFRFQTNRLYKETRQTIDLELPNAESETNPVKFLVKEPIESTITPTEPIESVDPTSAVFPTFETYEEMLQDDTHASKNRKFPVYSACTRQGLRKPLARSMSKKSKVPKCRGRQLTPGDCTDVVKYFGEYGSVKAGQCDTNNAIKICTVSEEEIQVSCDASPCKHKRISLGLFSHTIGKIEWQLVRDINRLSVLLENRIMSSEFGRGFALLKCEDGQGIQVLTFPKRLDRMEAVQKQGKRRFNINIVLEDSLSRAHFYRTLLKTSSTFRDIIYNQSIPSTLLEFEKVQSYASSTYSNLQRLFISQKYWNSKTHCGYRIKEFLANNTKYCTYGVEEMFSRYKKAGYSTLLQEDNCWYDDWGSFLDPRKGLARVKNEKSRLSRWKDFVQIVKKSGRGQKVDDYGMSILTCDVYKNYKVTNPFSSRAVPNICFAGRHYGSFFLEYVKKYTELNDIAAQPFIAYTHLLTSHETNGRRIVNDDESLADLFYHAAHLRNTVTIFTSDHGAKATDFAAYTTQGRQEVFQPLLFIIIPHEVSKSLGPEAMNALVVNQNRLVGLEDLHHSLVSILDMDPNIWATHKEDHPENWDLHPGSDKKKWVLHADPHRDVNVGVTPTRLRGLFKPVPLDRTCEQMKLRSDVLCLCEGMDKSVSNDSETVQWAAEFALGTLNNRIQKQYTTALRSKPEGLASGFYGYGACQRYTGTGIMRARHTVAGLEQKLFFSLLAKPFIRKTEEIFDVQVSFAMKDKANGITLNDMIRVSPYNKYEKCTDKGVDPKLCACHADRRNNTLWRNELYLKTTTQENFKLKPRTQILDQPCLAIISRVRRNNIGAGRWQNAIETYEAVNACPDVTYKLTISFKKARKTQISLKYPKSVTLLPRTVTFLLTAKNEWKYGTFIPRFKFEKMEKN
ncbi:Sodium potassium calcium exchanger 5 [Paramuricea clavata]|uniref:Sodium potassium calcium exchanger 5 n=1 Tax=Paramuricea clavata TaxID=317549 RepID=A0A7D9DFZ0_PARCT|nr:Sodium potassium calcium exchanger 5 [Paramuricea clavata]